MNPAGVVHHTALETRGGAARVAQILCGEQAGADFAVERTFELAESTAGEERLARRPLETVFDEAVDADMVLHLHAALDWPGLLWRLNRLGARVVVTLHDCRLFTGGCPYPLDCAHFEAGCFAPCPRGFAEAEALRKDTARALAALDPVLVSPSGWMKRLAEAHLPGHKVKVVPNGVEWGGCIADRADARRTFGIDESARVGLFAAHGAAKAAYKGGPAWRGLWERIAARVEGALALIVGGEGQFRQGDTIMLPYLDRPLMQAVMCAADVFLYPTLADNHPLLMLEAASCGCPGVAYAVGGVGEQIVHGRTGLLVAPGNENGFVEAAASVLRAPGSARRMGREAFAHGASRFAAGRMASDYLCIYRSL